MKDLQNLNAQIIEISEKVDSTVKEITMLVHKLNHVNANGLDFKKEHVEVNMHTLVDKPVVCKYIPSKDDLGGHEQVIDKKTGKIIELRTIAIGTITDVWIDHMIDDETQEALYAKATIWSYKYPKIMSCIEKLYTDGVSTSSVEVEIYKYGENPTKEYRYGTDFTYIGNCLLGSNVQPADANAGVLSIGDKEIAMAIEEDLENIESNQKGDEEMGDIQFNKGFEIRVHDTVEINALKLRDVSNNIYNILNPINPKTNDRQYNYYIQDVYVDYVIVEDWHDYKTLWKINYKIENDTVILEPKENWVQGYMGFIPEGITLDQLLADYEQKVAELNNKIETLEKEAKLNMEKTIEELTQELSSKETQITELSSKVTELEGKVAELNELVVSQETAKKGFESTIAELNSQVEELTPFKEAAEKAEKDAKVAELNSKYSKLLSEDVLKSERVQNAIAELNEVELSQVVVEEVLKAKATETASAEPKNEDVTIVVNSKQEDLLPTDKKSYWHSAKSE